MKHAHALLLWLWKRLPLPGWSRWLLLWTINTKVLVGVCAVIVDERERVLLLRHTYRGRYPWGLPGGWIAGSERPEDGLVRELREETGFTIAVGEIFHVRGGYRHPQVDLYFLCDLLGGEFRPNAEIDAMTFRAVDELPATLHPSQRAMIERGLARWRERRAAPATHEGNPDE